MNRRDFLLLRTDPRSRVVELSCEQLYMRYLDTQITGTRRSEAADAEICGEPTAVFDERTPQHLFEELARELRGVDVLRIVDSRWIAREDLKHDLENLLASFRARGGRVEMDGMS
jgi:hypothetical protein